MVKKARLWLCYVIRKILDSLSNFFFYVKDKSCNETYFELFNTVWQVFSQILCCLYYTEAIVLSLLCFEKELEVQEMS